VTEVKLRQSRHAPTVVCVEGTEGRTYWVSRSVCALDRCSGHALCIFSVIHTLRD